MLPFRLSVGLACLLPLAAFAADGDPDLEFANGDGVMFPTFSYLGGHGDG